MLRIHGNTYVMPMTWILAGFGNLRKPTKLTGGKVLFLTAIIIASYSNMNLIDAVRTMFRTLISDVLTGICQSRADQLAVVVIAMKKMFNGSHVLELQVAKQQLLRMNIYQLFKDPSGVITAHLAPAAAEDWNGDLQKGAALVLEKVSGSLLLAFSSVSKS